MFLQPAMCVGVCRGQFLSSPSLQSNQFTDHCNSLGHDFVFLSKYGFNYVLKSPCLAL